MELVQQPTGHICLNLWFPSTVFGVLKELVYVWDNHAWDQRRLNVIQKLNGCQSRLTQDQTYQLGLVDLQHPQ